MGIVGMLAAIGFSKAGNAVTLVAVPLFVLGETGSAVSTGIAGVFSTVPVIAGGVLGTPLVDRFGSRVSSIVADTVSGVTVLCIPLLALADALSFPVLLALVFVSGIFDTPGDTAKGIVLPELGERRGWSLDRVTGTSSAVQRSSMMVGSALAGFSVAIVGPANAFFVTAVAFAAAVGAVAVSMPRLVRTPAPEAHPSDGFWFGIRFLWRTPLLRSIVLLILLTNSIDSAALTVLMPVWATGASPDGALFGFMVGFFSAGALAGAAIFPLVAGRLPRRAFLVIALALAGPPPFVAMLSGASEPAVLTVFFLAGCAAGAINPILQSTMFRAVPASARGRVFGAVTAAASSAMPIGSLVGGVAVGAAGIGPVLVGAAALYLVLAFAPCTSRVWTGLDVGVVNGPNGVRTPS